ILRRHNSIAVHEIGLRAPALLARLITCLLVTCHPLRRRCAPPPSGEKWLHEVKFDGWRIQLHKHGPSAAAFTKNGHDPSSRVRWMIDALEHLAGVRSFVIDGELVACNDAGVPDFYRLHFRRHDRDLCVWAFDLLHLNGRDLRELPLIERKARLEKLILA